MDMADQNLTNLLQGVVNGKEPDRDLLDLVYKELHRKAVRAMQGERRNHTLQPTALVNEFWMKLAEQKQIEISNRAHFFALAASMMRKILIDHARSRDAAKRGGGVLLISLDKVDTPEERGFDLIALDEQMGVLKEIAPRQFQILELRFYGGLTINDMSKVLKLSPALISREIKIARSWLFARLAAS